MSAALSGNAFTKDAIYEFLEAEGFTYAIRLPTNQVLQESIAHLLTRPIGRPPNHVRRYYAVLKLACWRFLEPNQTPLAAERRGVVIACPPSVLKPRDSRGTVCLIKPYVVYRYCPDQNGNSCDKTENALHNSGHT